MELQNQIFLMYINADVNECEEKTACQCRDCKCKNTWGSYECSCSGSLLYIREHDICISILHSSFIIFSN